MVCRYGDTHEGTLHGSGPPPLTPGTSVPEYSHMAALTLAAIAATNGVR